MYTFSPNTDNRSLTFTARAWKVPRFFRGDVTHRFSVYFIGHGISDGLDEKVALYFRLFESDAQKLYEMMNDARVVKGERFQITELNDLAKSIGDGIAWELEQVNFKFLTDGDGQMLVATYR